MAENVESRLEAVERLASEHEKKLERIRMALGTIGQDGHPSLDVRLDRLEISQKSRTKIMWAIFTAVVLVLADSIASHLFARGAQFGAQAQQAAPK